MSESQVLPTNDFLYLIIVPELSSVELFLGCTSAPCGECRASSTAGTTRTNTVWHLSQGAAITQNHQLVPSHMQPYT